MTIDFSTATIEDCVASLEEELRAFPHKSEHHFADSAAFSLGLDVLEHAKAVALLMLSAVPRSGFSNARSAFESALDLAFLTSDVMQYDMRGALLHVHEVHEDVRLQGKMAKADVSNGFEARETPDLASVLEARTTSVWGTNSAQASMLRNATAEFLQRPKEKQKTWSGHNRVQLAKEMLKAIGEPEELADLMTVTYSDLSARSHPKMRMHQREWSVIEDGSIEVTSKPSDFSEPASLAILACSAAIPALARRRAFFSAT